MYKPAGIRTFHGDTLTPAKGRISNTLIAFFVLIQFAFGLDCGFVNWFNKKYRCFLKFVSLGVALWVILVNATPLKLFDKVESLWVLLSLFHYVCSVLMLRFAKIKVYDFFIKTSCKTDGKSKEIIGAIGIIYMIVIIITKVPVIISYCVDVDGHDAYCSTYGVPFPVYAIYSLCTDVVPIIMALIAYHELRSVMNVRQTLKTPEINVDVTKKLYIAVANVIDEIRPLYNNMLMVKLISELPKLLVTMYFMVRYITFEGGLKRFTGELIYVIHAVIQILVPAVISEMIKFEVEEIKLDLHNHVINREEDLKLKASVQSLLSYMEVRRLQHSAWRFVPTDLRLPVSLFGLCTTYFIVILQFTHLID